MARALSELSVEDALTDFIDYLTVEKGASENTVGAYRRDLQRFVHADPKRPLAAVTTADLDDHLTQLGSGQATGKPLAPASVERARASLRAWIRWALEAELIGTDPGAELAQRSHRQHLPHALTIEQMGAILEAGANQPAPIGARDSALLELLYATGARISEVIALAPDDVVFDDPAHVRLFGKGRKERLVPVGEYALEALRDYLTAARPALAARRKHVPARGRGNAAEALFLNTRGLPLSRQSAWEIVSQAAKRAGIEEPVSPHMLRHSFATHLLEGGASIRDVQELLGHASLTTTQIYTRVTIATLREVHSVSHPRAH